MDKTNDEYIIDYISGKLCSEDCEIFEYNLKNNSELQKQLQETQDAYDLFSKINAIEVPRFSQVEDVKFYKMLGSEKSKQMPRTESFWVKLVNKGFLRPALYGAAMLFIGIVFGNIYTINKMELTNNDNNLNAIRYGNKMQGLAVVSMLQLPSASKRLQAVSLVENNQNADDVVISALFNTLNNDNNVNVRLSVLDTLSQFSHSAKVRARLVSSITNQNSPMVQVAIAELMLYMQEGNAVKPLKQLLDNKDLIEPVREKILYAVNELI